LVRICQPPAKISPFLPAAILGRTGIIKFCVVGTAAVILFGSDLVLTDLDLTIDDEQLTWRFPFFITKSFAT